MIQISCVFFCAGCIISGQAQNFTVLLAGRTIMGIGGQSPGTRSSVQGVALISDPPKQEAV